MDRTVFMRRLVRWFLRKFSHPFIRKPCIHRHLLTFQARISPGPSLAWLASALLRSRTQWWYPT